MIGIISLCLELLANSCMCCLCLHLLQMLFSREGHKAYTKKESHGTLVDPTVLDKFECELQDMLNIVEKHMESNDEDEKVCGHRITYIFFTNMSFTPCSLQ